MGDFGWPVGAQAREDAILNEGQKICEPVFNKFTEWQE
jgi:hypothetical protein